MADYDINEPGTTYAGYPGGMVIPSGQSGFYGNVAPGRGKGATIVAPRYGSGSGYPGISIPRAPGTSSVYGNFTPKAKEGTNLKPMEGLTFNSFGTGSVGPRPVLSRQMTPEVPKMPAVPKFSPSVVKPGVEENLPGGLTTERVAPGALVPQFSPSTANPAKTPLGVLDPNTKPGRKLGLQPKTNPQTKPNPQPQPQNKSPKRSSNQVKTKEKTRRLLSPGSAVAAPGQFGSDVRWKTTFSRY